MKRITGGINSSQKASARCQFGQSSWKGSSNSLEEVSEFSAWFESLARVNCLAAVSFLPNGLPGGADFRAGLEGSRCWVSSCQVRPHQISRTVFSPTPYFRAKTALRVFLVFGSDADGLSSNIATACSEVRIARGLATFPDLHEFDMSFSSCATIFKPEGGFQKKRMQNFLML